MEQWINTVDKTFIHLKKQHTHVFVMGYSLGSLLALELASGRTLSGIILLSTALKFTRSQHLRQMIAEDTRPLIPLDEIFDKEDPQYLQGYEMWPALGFCEVLRLSHQVRRRLQNIHAPVLACHGQKDTLTPRKIWIISKTISEVITWKHTCWKKSSSGCSRPRSG